MRPSVIGRGRRKWGAEAIALAGPPNSARLSAPSLREFLETVVAETKAKRIHIIAHSMGNEALNLALTGIDQETLKKLSIGEMMLASPNLDPDIFKAAHGV